MRVMPVCQALCAPCHEAVTGKRLMLDDASLDQLVGEHCFVSMQLLLLQAVV
jgi:hypothetical protein